MVNTLNTQNQRHTWLLNCSVYLFKLCQSERLSDLTGAPAGCGTPRGDVSVAAAPLLLQFGTVTVQIGVVARVGCGRSKERSAGVLIIVM